MRKPSAYRAFIDEMVEVCRSGLGQIGARRARAALWNQNATADCLPEQHAMNELLARLGAAEREILAGMLAGEVVTGVFETLKALEKFRIAPFEDGYEASPLNDFIGRLNDWDWPDEPLSTENDGAAAQVFVGPFCESDQAPLEALWSLVFPDDPPWNAPARMIENKLRVQPDLLLVASAGQTIVGAIMAGFDGVRGWLYHLAVLPDWRRRGIATKLVRRAESELAAYGCSKVNLQVRATNSEVIAFYRRLGYLVEERVSMGRRLPQGSSDE